MNQPDNSRVRIVSKVNRQTSEHECYYRLTLPTVYDKGFYRSVASYDAFAHSSKGYCWHPDYLYCCRRLDEVLDWQLDKMSQVPVIDCLDVWDFYGKIGWEYKIKRYRGGVKCVPPKAYT